MEKAPLREVFFACASCSARLLAMTTLVRNLLEPPPRTAAYVVLHDVPIKRFMIRIEAPTWEDFEVVELPRLPAVGETIQTKYGTCLVTQTDASSGTAPYQGKIVVRLP